MIFSDAIRKSLSANLPMNHGPPTASTRVDETACLTHGRIGWEDLVRNQVYLMPNATRSRFEQMRTTRSDAMGTPNMSEHDYPPSIMVEIVWRLANNTFLAHCILFAWCERTTQVLSTSGLVNSISNTINPPCKKLRNLLT